MRRHAMTVLRWIGWLLAAGAAAALGSEAVAWLLTGSYEVQTLGRVWRALDPGGPAALAVAAETGPPWAYPLAATVLRLPAWAVLGVPAVALVWAAGARRLRAAPAAPEAASSVSAPPDP